MSATPCRETTQIRISEATKAPAVPIGPDVQPSPVPTRSVASFVDSVGVVIHATYTDTPYVDQDQVLEALDQLGVRHVRDEFVPAAEERQSAFLDRLGEQGGCALMVLGGHGRGFTEQDMARGLALLAEHADVISGVEGPNELDNRDIDEWPRLLSSYEDQIVDGLAESEALEGLAVSSGSMAWPQSWRKLSAPLPDLDLVAIHPYPGGRAPERGVVDLHQDAAGNAREDLPAITTETGYHDAVNTAVDHPGVPEDVAAAYVPRLVLDAFSRGVTRTYLYELVDEFPDPEDDEEQASFGLYRMDWSPKPAADSLGNLLALLGPHRELETADEGDSLSVAVRTEAGEDIRSLVLSDDDHFWIALWQDDSLYDVRQREQLDSEPIEATVVLAEPRDATVHRPIDGIDAVESAEQADAIEVAVPADPLLIKVTR